MEPQGVVKPGHEANDAVLSSWHQSNASRYDFGWFV